MSCPQATPQRQISVSAYLVKMAWNKASTTHGQKQRLTFCLNPNKKVSPHRELISPGRKASNFNGTFRHLFDRSHLISHAKLVVMANYATARTPSGHQVGPPVTGPLAPLERIALHKDAFDDRWTPSRRAAE